MSIFDDIAKSLDSLFKIPSSDSVGLPDSVSDISLDPGNSNLNPLGVSANDPSPVAPRPFVRSIGSNVANSILQKRESAFTTIDVDPLNFASLSYATQIPLSKIQDKLGYDFDNDTVTQNGITFNTNAWRSVPIPITGDFLKLEFLPSFVSSQQTWGPQSVGNPVGSPSNSDISKFDETDPSNIPSHAGVLTQPNADPTDKYSAFSSSRLILVTFDDLSNPFIVMRHGDIIETKFTRLFITTKYWNNRFSLIIGNGSRIVPNQSYRSENMRPAYSPGFGMWENESRHCTPFCFTANGQQTTNDNSGTNLITSTQVLAGKSVGSCVLLAQSHTGLNGIKTPYQTGVITGWITQISLGIKSSLSTGEIIIGQLIVYVGNAQTVGPSGSSSSLIYPNYTFSKTKLLASLPFTAVAPSGTTAAFANLQLQPVEPIRFSVPQNMGNSTTNFPGLIVQIDNSSFSTGSLDAIWSMQGYVWGKLFKQQSPNSVNGEWSQAETLMNNPFPCDRDMIIDGI